MNPNHVFIIYASASGNVEIVCEKVSEILNSQNIPNTLLRAEQTPFETISSNQLFILATSTWEHGELNPFFRNLLKEMSSNDLTGKKAAFIGLGDKRYEPVLFCRGMEIVRETFLKQQGTEFYHELKIDGEPYGLLDTVVSEWATGFVQTLTNSGNDATA